MKEPFRTLYWTLVSKNHPTGKWHYDVKMSNDGEAIYIGDSSNHCTVLKGTDGYHHTEDQECLNGQHLGYDTLEKMLERAEYNPRFYTNKIIDALRWLVKNKVNW